MRQPTKRAFILSSVGHGAVLLGLAVTSLLSNCSKDEPVVHVFKLLPSPASAVAPEPIRTVVRPKPAPPPPPAPKVEKPKPPPPAPKVEKPKPPPAIQKPKKVAPRPVVKKPEPVLKKITRREWLENQAKKQKPKPVPRPQKVKVQPLDVDSFKVEVEAPKIPNRPRLNNDAIKQQDIYLARAGQIIETHWMRLKKGANLRGPANATMQFRILGNGNLWSLDLIETSVSPEFNRMVHTAFRNAGNLGRPPSPIDYPLTMTFRLN